MAEYGFVYCMSNRGMPGIYKIGFTRNSPHLRAKQLSMPTGVPAEFDVLWYAELENADLIERELHERFSEFRVCQSREFFKACPFEMFESLDSRQDSDWHSGDFLFLIRNRSNAISAIKESLIAGA